MGFESWPWIYLVVLAAKLLISLSNNIGRSVGAGSANILQKKLFGRVWMELECKHFLSKSHCGDVGLHSLGMVDIICALNAS